MRLFSMSQVCFTALIILLHFKLIFTLQDIKQMVQLDITGLNCYNKLLSDSIHDTNDGKNL